MLQCGPEVQDILCPWDKYVMVLLHRPQWINQCILLNCNKSESINIYSMNALFSVKGDNVNKGFNTMASCVVESSEEKWICHFTWTVIKTERSLYNQNMDPAGLWVLANMHFALISKKCSLMSREYCINITGFLKTCSFGNYWLWAVLKHCDICK